MDSIRVNRTELVGKSQSKTAVLESLVRANALNLTGNVDYNKKSRKAEICQIRFFIYHNPYLGLLGFVGL